MVSHRKYFSLIPSRSSTQSLKIFDPLTDFKRIWHKNRVLKLLQALKLLPGLQNHHPASEENPVLRERARRVWPLSVLPGLLSSQDAAASRTPSVTARQTARARLWTCSKTQRFWPRQTAKHGHCPNAGMSWRDCLVQGTERGEQRGCKRGWEGMDGVSKGTRKEMSV